MAQMLQSTGALPILGSLTEMEGTAKEMILNGCENLCFSFLIRFDPNTATTWSQPFGKHMWNSGFPMYCGGGISSCEANTSKAKSLIWTSVLEFFFWIIEYWLQWEGEWDI